MDLVAVIKNILQAKRKKLYMDERESLVQLYDSHPVNASNILERLGHRVNKSTSELDLAFDNIHEITDQNHIGGVQFVEELASLAQITRTSKVLDLGCGIGGSARYLAWKYGCSVMGVEMNLKRCSDARALNRLVGLQKLVTIKHGNMLSAAVASNQYDIIWGQGSWGHLESKSALFHRWSRALRTHGKYAFEDCYLLKKPGSKINQEKLDTLSTLWMAHLVERDGWTESLVKLGFVIRFEDLTERYQQYCLKMLATIKTISNYPKNEKSGYEYAAHLAIEGIVGYFRIIAQQV